MVLEGYFKEDHLLAGWLYLEEHPHILKIEGYSFTFNKKTLKFEPEGNGRLYL